MKKYSVAPGLLVAVSQKEDGSMAAPVAFQRFADQLSPKSRTIVSMQQVHGNQVVVVDEATLDGGLVFETDGLVTDRKKTALVVRTADCIPLVVFDPKQGVLGLGHVGWRGAVKGIHQNLVSVMKKTFASEVEDMVVWLGPSIQRCCYVFSDRPQQADMKGWGDFVTKEADGWHVDLPGFVARGLQNSGVVADNLSLTEACTAHNSEWFSYFDHKRTGEPDGRFVTIVMRE